MKIVALSSDECENCVAYLKAQSLPKKRFKPRRNWPLNGNAMRVRTMHPRTHGAPDSERDQQTKKHHIFAPTAGPRCTIFPKFCTLIELVVPIVEGVIHFSIHRIVFPTGCRKPMSDSCVVKLTDSMLLQVDHCKYLGLYLDKNMDWSAHIDYVYNK